MSSYKPSSRHLLGSVSPHDLDRVDVCLSSSDRSSTTSSSATVVAAAAFVDKVLIRRISISSEKSFRTKFYIQKGADVNSDDKMYENQKISG
jgi:hypothetical protein